MVSGFGLVAVELFLLPGLGVPGIVGGLLIFAGLVGSFISGNPLDPAVRLDLFRGIAATMLGMLGAGIGIWFAWRSVPGSRFGRSMVLAAEIGGAKVAGSMPPSEERSPTFTPGEIGTAITPLRTAGRVRIGDHVVDARSTGAFIETGAEVKVVESDRFGVVVEPIDS